MKVTPTIRRTTLLVILLLIAIVRTTSAGELVNPSSTAGDSLCWYDITTLGVEGRGWTDTKTFYDRLPAKAEGIVRDPVWNLSHHSAGMCVRFVTDAREIRARWSLMNQGLDMSHMPATGVSGLDLYVNMEDSRWRWIGATKPNKYPTNEATLVSGIPEGKREFLLYLPLYNGVTSVEIAVAPGCIVETADHWPGGVKPILFYGTSITHGGCASRPGMCHPAILQRKLGYPVINLGFSGNGRMEPEMADLLSELDPAVYVLDCLPNMNGEMVRERMEPFVRRLRESHPDTPILFVEDRSYGGSFLVTSRRAANVKNRAELRKAYYRLKDAGVKELYYLIGDHLVGDDDEGTVDSSHPTDLGFMRQADEFYEVLKPILFPNDIYLEQEWTRSNPDVVVYLPKGSNDGDNEHFLVFEAPKSDELLALWTQSSVEGRGDNRAMLARSMDQVNWSEPIVLAGKTPGDGTGQASWAFPIVADTGRIYVFFTKQIDKWDERQSSGAIGSLYSDDNGHTWVTGADITFRKNKFDNPDSTIPPNWIVWQKPIRDSKGRWIAGYTQTSSVKAVPAPSRNWPDRDSRSAFMRFDNIAEGPDPTDIRITWLPEKGPGIEVPHKIFPEISTSQEPSIVLLPDGRLMTVMRTMTGYIWYSVSDDDGASWRKPEPLRYRDGGEMVPNPIASDPLYRMKDGRFLLVYNNNPGTMGKWDQFKAQWETNQLNHLRNPAFIALGEFRPGAHQPVWLSQPKQLLDTDGLTFGPKGTASIAMYPSLTEQDGVRMLWYPDRKHFLLGKRLTDEVFDGMTVPK